MSEQARARAVWLGRWWSEALSAARPRHIHAELLRSGTEGAPDGGPQRAGDGYQKQLVEAFRSVAEILIWGDQNDTRVFE